MVRFFSSPDALVATQLSDEKTTIEKLEIVRNCRLHHLYSRVGGHADNSFWWRSTPAERWPDSWPMVWFVLRTIFKLRGELRSCRSISRWRETKRATKAGSIYVAGFPRVATSSSPIAIQLTANLRGGNRHSRIFFCGHTRHGCRA